MTFSIVGQVGDAYGVAVASRFIAVGAVVPAARIGIGACATQALARVSYKQDSLDELAAGHTADAAVRRVTSADADAAHRQLGVVGAQTQASYTGTDCLPWAGGVSGRDGSGGYAIQGNILAGPEVVERMQEAWLGGAGLPLPRRLVQALLAGDAAGGDSRGRQAAALYAVAPGFGVRRLGGAGRPEGRRPPRGAPRAGAAARRVRAASSAGRRTSGPSRVPWPRRSRGGCPLSDTAPTRCPTRSRPGRASATSRCA